MIFRANFKAKIYQVEFFEQSFLYFQKIFFIHKNPIIPHDLYDLFPTIETIECNLEELFEKIHKIGFKTILLTDNGEKRTQKFGEENR